MPNFKKSDGYQMKRGAAPKFRELGSSPTAPGDSPNKKFSWGQAAGGAAKGAQMGAKFGPWGAAIGGVLGGAAGGILGGKAEKEEEAAMLDEENKNKLAAEALEAKERESLGYSEE